MIALRQLGADAHGIEYAQAKVATFHHRHPGEVDVVRVGDIESMDYRSGTFDLVIANEVLEHVGDDRKALREIHRVLRPGGHLLIFSPNRLYPFESHGVVLRYGGRSVPRHVPFVPYLPVAWVKHLLHYRARNYWPTELRRLVREAGFVVLATDYLWQTFENISGHQPTALKLSKTLLRRLSFFLESIPIIRTLGVSQFILAQKA